MTLGPAGRTTPSGAPGARELVVVVGLTGVGKTTLVRRLVAGGDVTLLPDRRELADRIAIPWAQRERGEPERAVDDRLERFRLTAAYRDRHPGGLAEALAEYLDATAPAETGRVRSSGSTARRVDGTVSAVLFDNLRGPDEIGWALERLPLARFLMLDAAPRVRVRRLLERRSDFDRATMPESTARTIATSAATLGLDAPVLAELRATAASVASEEARGPRLAAALAIVAAEHRNYGGDATATLLRAAPRRACIIDTADLSPEAVADAARTWLRAPTSAEPA